MSDDLDWLRRYVEGGARVPISERRAAVVAGEAGVAAVDRPEPPEMPAALLGTDMEWYEVDIPRYVLEPRTGDEARAGGEPAAFAVRCTWHRQVVPTASGAAHQQPGRFETLQRRDRQMGRVGS